MKKANKQKKEEHFYFDSIGSRPSRGKEEMPIWCDFVELLCLTTPGKFISRGEVRDAVYEGKEFAPQEDDDDSDEKFLDDEESTSTQLGSDATLAAQRAMMGSNNGRSNDKKETIINDWFRNLSVRSTLFNELYPFAINEQEATISLKSNLKPYHKLYIYFLLAGNLSLFSSKLGNKITTDFEFICFDAQKKLFPVSLGAVVGYTHFFGKNPEAEGIFTGSLSKKFLTLAQKIKSYKIDVSSIPSNNTADRGIDLISYLGFHEDEAFGVPIVVSQCACSYEEWRRKQFDHHPDKYKRIGLFDVDYIRFMYIPFFYRSYEGQWFQPIDVCTVVIDRLRLMRILSADKKSFSPRALEWAELILLESRDRELYAEFILERST